MRRHRVYHAALGLLGVVMGGPALRSLLDGTSSIPVVLLAVGGCGMALTACYELVTGDPSEFEIGSLGYWGILFAVALTLVGATLQYVA